MPGSNAFASVALYYRRMFAKIIASLLGLWIVAACGIANNILFERMVTDVNAQLPDGRRFSRWGWLPGTAHTFFGEYRRLGLPRRPLVWRRILVGVQTVVLLVLATLWAYWFPIGS